MTWLNIEKIDIHAQPVSDYVPRHDPVFLGSWDYVVRSYKKDGTFTIETVCKDEHALDTELAAIISGGEDADVFKIDHRNQERLSKIGSLRSEGG